MQTEVYFAGGSVGKLDWEADARGVQVDLDCTLCGEGELLRCYGEWASGAVLRIGLPAPEDGRLRLRRRLSRETLKTRAAGDPAQSGIQSRGNRTNGGTGTGGTFVYCANRGYRVGCAVDGRCGADRAGGRCITAFLPVCIRSPVCTGPGFCAVLGAGRAGGAAVGSKGAQSGDCALKRFT